MEADGSWVLWYDSVSVVFTLFATQAVVMTGAVVLVGERAMCCAASDWDSLLQLARWATAVWRRVAVALASWPATAACWLRLTEWESAHQSAQQSASRPDCESGIGSGSLANSVCPRCVSGDVSESLQVVVRLHVLHVVWLAQTMA